MRVLLTLAIFAVPGFALAQSKSDATESRRSQDLPEKRLAQLEAKLEALLDEIHSLRSGKNVEEKKELGVAPGKRKPTEFKWTIDEKEGKKIVIIPQADAKRKLEFKYQLADGKRIVEVPSAPGVKTEKRVVVVEDGTAKPATTVRPAVSALTQYYSVVGAEDANTVHLTRVTYTLGGAKAKALDSFLKDNAKAKVLETKLDDDKLIVTTTPAVQTTIGQLVGLMTGKLATQHNQIYYYGVEAGKAAKPTAPSAPSAPKKPKAPKEPKSPERDK